ncbi:MAG: carboxypeptidase regulatory-like domain-containing protein [Acidimicrobiales bacterium]
MSAPPRRLRGDDGFTLAELVISTMIMGIVLTAVTAAVIVGLRNGSRSVDLLGPSTDAALLSHHFTADVQSASVSDISPGVASGCDYEPPAGSRNVLALAWLDNAGELPVRHAVAYHLDPATAQLSRVSCDGESGVQVAVLARQVLSADARVDTSSGGISLDVTAGEQTAGELNTDNPAVGPDPAALYRFQLRAYGRLAGSDASGLGSGVARLPRGEVAGTVTKYDDAAGTTNPEPVQGVTLSLTNAETDVVTTTGTNGRFYFGTLEDGRYDLTLETSAFLPTARQSTIASEPNRITVPVTVDAAAQGDTAAGSEGAAAELAQALSVVQVGSVAGTARTDRYVMLGGLKVELSGPVAVETDTDASGAYAFEDVPAGGYTVEVKPPEGYVAVSGAECVVTVVGGERSTCPEAVFKARIAAITGMVRTDTDVALPGVNVVLSGATNRTVVTGSDGSYRFGDLLDGSYTVTVQAPAGYGLISGGTCAVIIAG